MKVACVILTQTEKQRIEDCLKVIHPHVDWLLVLDGESTDGTVEIAEKYANKVEVKHFSGSFAEEKNHARTLVPKDCDWIIWADADERFDDGFLGKMKEFIEEGEKKGGICFRLPRVNLPDGKNFPDYQVRLFKNSRDIEWRGKVHEVPYYVPYGCPLDQLDNPKWGKRAAVMTVLKYPIIHLPRREDERRGWW